MVRIFGEKLEGFDEIFFVPNIMGTRVAVALWLLLALASALVPSLLPRALLRLHDGPSASGNDYQVRGARNSPRPPPPPINEFINADRVRLIVPGNASGEEIMLGIFGIQEAMAKADEMELDLVLINDKADPPVCKIIDYGKFKYIQEKKKKDNLKKQVKTEIKEVKMSYKIDDHDFDVRMRAVQRFLEDGDRVKVVIQFKGREMQYKDLGKDLLMRIFKPVEETALMEGTPKIEGKSVTMLLGPKKTI